MTESEQLDFPSLAFPADRRVLTVSEVADRWGCSQQHIIDLLEEGKLAGFDISSPNEFVRVSRVWFEALSRRLNLDHETLLYQAACILPNKRTPRSHWRIPVEGYKDFIRSGHSQSR